MKATLERETIHDLLGISHLRGRCLQAGFDLCVAENGKYNLTKIEGDENYFFRNEGEVKIFLDALQNRN